MERRLLGHSGVEVSRTILGCGNFGGIGSDLAVVGKGEADGAAFAVMDAAWERGINAFDTASSYGGGASERVIGRWRASRKPDGLVLTSKAFHPRFPGDDEGLGPERLSRVVHDSLQLLGVEQLDIYLTHAADPATPLAETLGALDELRREGAIGAVGVSNVDGAYVRECLQIADARGYARIEYVQNEYSLLARESERELLPLCAEHGIGFAAFSPLAGGWLTGKYRRGAPYPEGSRMTLRPEPYGTFLRDEVFDGIEALEQRARAHGVHVAVLALAWVLSKPTIAAAVVGPRRPEQLDVLLPALQLQLSEAERDALAELFP
jgi:aryl-alcohol dehydrogenase-like predicted oxidoreductase